MRLTQSKIKFSILLAVAFFVASENVMADWQTCDQLVGQDLNNIDPSALSDYNTCNFNNAFSELFNQGSGVIVAAALAGQYSGFFGDQIDRMRTVVEAERANCDNPRYAGCAGY